MRVLLYLVVAVIILSLLRSVLEFIGKAFTSASSPGPADSRRPPPQSGGQPQTLKKDPVCGTFVSPATAMQKSKGGETYYFCSAECKDKF
jgi:Cu+-exporting ATPase